MTGLYAEASLHRPELEPRPLQQIVQEMYKGSIPCEIGRSGVVELGEADAHAIFMAREAISLADSFVVHSHYAAQLARHDAAPEHRYKVRVAPFAFPDPNEFSGFLQRRDRPVIGTFGVVAPVKQTDKVVDAFSVVAHQRGDCTLMVAGPPAGMGDYDLLEARASELGLSGRMRLLGYVDSDAFREAIAQTTVAVQLRAMSMGENPASVGDCLAAGVPTVVTAVGSTRELPDHVMVKVAPDIRPEVLARTILELLDDSPRRSSLHAAAQAFARDHSFEHAARFFYQELVLCGRGANAQAAA